MDRESVNEANTTLISLISIVQSCLKLHGQELRRFLQLRPEYLQIKRAEQPVNNNGAYDKSEYDRISSLLEYFDDKVIAFDLLLDLQVALEANPYPGRQVRLIQAAYELFPAVQVWHVKGYAAWCGIMREFGLPAGYKIAFPVVANDVNIAEVEITLLQLVREDNTILASDIPPALKLSATGKQYKTIKQQLERRNWAWSVRRIGQKFERIVTPPAANCVTELHPAI